VELVTGKHGHQQSGGQPRVDEIDPGLVEVFGVAGGQGRVPVPADRGDLGVESVDRLAFRSRSVTTSA
jgi:hypothetical protein